MVDEWLNEIRERALLGKAPISSWRSNKTGKIGFDNLVFIPSQLSIIPIDYFRENIISETIIGKNSEKPLKLKIPIMISAMSFGALSKEAKIALAKASSLVGTAANTGEGGMLPEERKNAKLLVAQYSSGRFGVDEEYIKKADAIELKFGQSAKPNQGGLLPKDKVTEEIAKIRKVPLGQDIHSPPYHPDIKNVNDLKKKVDWLRDLNDGPIIIKIAATDVEKDVKIALKANPDVIAIDGLGGGTGAAPKVLLHEFGIPAVSALVKARKVLDKAKAKQELIIGGGFNIGAEVAKALSLGADVVFMASALLVAMGCTYCKMCYLGKCPLGITTQDPELRKRVNIEEASKKVANFLTACSEEVKMVAATFGYKNIHQLNRSGLRSLDLTVSQITGIPLV